MKPFGVWVAVMLLLVGCGSKKKLSDSFRATTNLEESTSERQSTREESVTHFGDSLAGRYPLPLLLPPGIPGIQYPVQFTASSTGIDLEITLDSAGISYQAVAKPMVKESFKESSSEKEREFNSEATIKEESEEVETKRGWPLWLLLVVCVLGGLAAVAFQVFKKFQNPFKLF